MKKLLSLIAAAAVAVGAVSCSSKKAGSSSQSSKADTTEAVTTMQPVPADHSRQTTTTAAASTTAAAETTVTTAAAQEATHQPDPLGGDAFEYNDDGAVVFDKPVEDSDDKTLIAAAQALFESAGHVQMLFTVGCPYKVDYDNYIENDLGWQFYRITESGISRFSDIEDGYYKVFSRRYPSSELSELYIEKNGAVYALCGNRGSNIYYSSSRITGIKSRTDDEIVFTVENYYDGSDFDQESYTETDDFSVVIENGNVWKAGQFTLPY
ncbi:MAG: hypothetical protein IKH96_05890 [Ruminococcus sp.]|uniref:hypothetical protein n=1 Tax=Ruminococcus sp. TaxID=41978 RepID=UPI0025ECAEF3|nr:hypothetical protein [Ruminococcus sp.]MBR3665635.1 hypothetical protein [Ruminococcus sp.]MBR6995533.1 hypothetical protein [Ruminococcus sp.]